MAFGREAKLDELKSYFNGEIVIKRFYKTTRDRDYMGRTLKTYSKKYFTRVYWSKDTQNLIGMYPYNDYGTRFMSADYCDGRGPEITAKKLGITEDELSNIEEKALYAYFQFIGLKDEEGNVLEGKAFDKEVYANFAKRYTSKAPSFKAYMEMINKPFPTRSTVDYTEALGNAAITKLIRKLTDEQIKEFIKPDTTKSLATVIDETLGDNVAYPAGYYAKDSVLCELCEKAVEQFKALV